MKKISFVLLTSILFAACNSSKHGTASATAPTNASLTGLWAEYWDDKNVNYVDTIKIQLIADTLKLNCTNNKTYVYSHAKFNNGKLTFTMDNTSSPDEKFYVYYNLNLRSENNLKGSIVNSKEVKVNVKLKKIQ